MMYFVRCFYQLALMFHITTTLFLYLMNKVFKLIKYSKEKTTQ